MAADAYADDSTIPNEAILWRRIHADQVVADRNVDPPRLRPTSDVFQDSSDMTPMSVVLADPQRRPESILDLHQDDGIASFTAEAARAHGLRICAADRDPPNDPAHTYVAGQKTASVRKRLARASYVEILPAGHRVADEFEPYSPFLLKSGGGVP
jgi:hypothetical protein